MGVMILKRNELNLLIIVLLILTLISQSINLVAQNETSEEFGEHQLKSMGVYLKWSSISPRYIDTSPTIVDLDADGTKEILLKRHTLYCFNHNG